MPNSLLTTADKNFLNEKVGYTSAFLDNKTYIQLLMDIKKILMKAPAFRVEKGGTFNRQSFTLYFEDPQLLIERIQMSIVQYCLFVTQQTNYLMTLKKAGVIQTADSVDSSMYY